MVTTVADCGATPRRVGGPARQRPALPSAARGALRGRDRVARRRRDCASGGRPTSGFAAVDPEVARADPGRRRGAVRGRGARPGRRRRRAHRSRPDLAVGRGAVDWLARHRREAALARPGRRSRRPFVAPRPGGSLRPTDPRASRAATRRRLRSRRRWPSCSPRSTCCSAPTTAVPAFAAAGPPPTRDRRARGRTGDERAVHDARQPVLEPRAVGSRRRELRGAARSACRSWVGAISTRSRSGSGASSRRRARGPVTRDRDRVTLLLTHTGRASMTRATRSVSSSTSPVRLTPDGPRP